MISSQTVSELSIIIISYNTKQMTLECLASVYKETLCYSYDILVYDNDSQDGSAQAIAQQFPQVKLIAGKVNIGFARANNELIKSIKTKYVLLLNPDTVILDQAIDHLMDFSKQKPNAGIWGGKTLNGDKSLNPGSCFRRMTLWNQICRATGLAVIFKQSEFFNSENYGGWLRDTVRDVDIVCGCFFLITLDLWVQLDGFNKKYFMYAEEADLCLRAKKRGCSPTVTPQAVIIHYGGGSETIRSDKMVRLLRAKVTLANDHWSNWQKPLASILLRGWVLSRIIAYQIICTLMLASSKKAIFKESLGEWKTIWQRIPEWQKGITGQNNKQKQSSNRER